MMGLDAACRALHHSLHSFVFGAAVIVGSHKCTSKMSSSASSVWPQSWVVTGPSLSSLFRESALALLLAAPFLAVPASGLSNGRAAGSRCRGLSVPEASSSCCRRTLVCLEGTRVAAQAAWMVGEFGQGKEILVFRSCSPCLQLG